MSSAITPIAEPQFIRELGPVDIAILKGLVGRISEPVWNLENERKENQFDCCHRTRHIVFDSAE